MAMKRVALDAGFTIVETMIVLAVTGLMFMAVVTTWGGRQRSSEYQTAIRDAATLVQQSITDVTNGYFPSTDGFTCSGSSAGLNFAGVTGKQGSNSTCIFLGKAIELKADGDNPVKLNKYVVAGWAGATGTDALSWKPTLAPRMAESLNIPIDLKIESIKSGGRTYSGIAILTDVGITDNGRLLSGEQPVRLYGLTESITVPNDASGLKLTTDNFDQTPITSEITICFKSQGTPNYGLVKFGKDGSLTDVRTETKDSCS